jgi:hypothetical protein
MILDLSFQLLVNGNERQQARLRQRFFRQIFGTSRIHVRIRKCYTPHHLDHGTLQGQDHPVHVHQS